MPKFFISRYRREHTAPPLMIKSLPSLFHFSPLVFFGILFAGLCLLYVWQITALSMQGYVKNDLLRQQASLTESVQRMDFQVLQYQSLGRVDERLGELSLVRDPHVDRVTREEFRMSLSAR